jgi:hypothetical protein
MLKGEKWLDAIGQLFAVGSFDLDPTCKEELNDLEENEVSRHESDMLHIVLYPGELLNRGGVTDNQGYFLVFSTEHSCDWAMLD